MSHADSPPKSGRRARVALGGFLVLVAAAYVFFISAGRWTTWFSWSAFYDTQAEGFRAGHLYAALPEHAGHWDYSRHDGHWYIYWGLYPALAMAAGKALFRVHGAIGDEVLVFLFLVGRAVAGSLLICAMARRSKPRPPAFAVGLALLVFAFASPTPFLLARAAIYEAAIAAGSCFLVAGLLLAFHGLFAATPRAAGRWLAAASVSFGLAAGTRTSLLPAVALLTAFTILARWRLDGKGLRDLLRISACAGAPVAALTFAHLVLNRLRFGAWTEFGARYQVGFAFKMGARFIPANLFLYLFQRPELSCRFPYLVAGWNRSRALAPGWLTFAQDYRATEPTIGLLYAAPFVCLGLAGATVALAGAARARRGPAPSADAPEDRPRWRWLRGALAIGAVAAALPVLLIFSVSLRYQADFASCVLLMAMLGGWRLLAAPASRAGRIAAASLYAALALATVTAGLLLGFVGYFDHFDHHNPQLMGRLHHHLDVCGDGRR